MSLEICTRCQEPTGHAGRGEDSIYWEDYGPFCHQCSDHINDYILDYMTERKATPKPKGDVGELVKGLDTGYIKYTKGNPPELPNLLWKSARALEDQQREIEGLREAARNV